MTARYNSAMRSADLSVKALEHEAIEAARNTPAETKLREGLLLFDRTCRIMAAGIRDERPDADDAAVLEALRTRLRIARVLETRDQ